MQPFKLLDFVGLDTTSYIADGWREKAEQGQISKELVQPIPMLEEMVKEGKMGRKSGKGFYNVSHECGQIVSSRLGVLLMMMAMADEGCWKRLSEP